MSQHAAKTEFPGPGFASIAGTTALSCHVSYRDACLCILTCLNRLALRCVSAPSCMAACVKTAQSDAASAPVMLQSACAYARRFCSHAFGGCACTLQYECIAVTYVC